MTATGATTEIKKKRTSSTSSTSGKRKKTEEVVEAVPATIVETVAATEETKKRKRTTSSKKKNTEQEVVVETVPVVTVVEQTTQEPAEKKRKVRKSSDCCPTCLAPKNWAVLIGSGGKRRRLNKGLDGKTKSKKGAPTAYILFSSENFNTHRQQLFKQEQEKSADVQDIKSIKCTAVGKFSGAIWKEMSEDQKKTYKDRVQLMRKAIVDAQVADILGASSSVAVHVA